MEFSTSTFIGLIAVMPLMAALTWVLLRALPRTRGKLRAETARLDAAGRRSAATLLEGWGPAGGRALAAGVAALLVFGVGSALWIVGLGAPGAADDAVPMLLGLLAPVLAALVALGVLAWIVSRRRNPDTGTGSATFAGLRPRGALTFGPRWALAIPSLAALVLCGWLVVTGLFSSRDGFGRFTVLEVERLIAADDPARGPVGPLTAQTVTASHWPGWFVTVPSIVAALLLLVLAALLLRGLAQAARPTDPDLFGVDDLARTLKAKFVATLAGSGLLATLGAVATSTGGAMATLAGDMRMGADGPEFFYHEAMLSGYWIYLGAVLLNLLALLLLVVAIGAVLELAAAARQAAVAVALGGGPVPNP